MSADIFEPLDRILTIDLNKLTSRVEKRPDLIQAGLGGSGIAIRLLEEECPPGCDPLSPENPIILAVGPSGWPFPHGLQNNCHVQITTYRKPGRKPCRRKECSFHPLGRLWSHCDQRQKSAPGLSGDRFQRGEGQRCLGTMGNAQQLYGRFRS